MHQKRRKTERGPPPKRIKYTALLQKKPPRFRKSVRVLPILTTTRTLHLSNRGFALTSPAPKPQLPTPTPQRTPNFFARGPALLLNHTSVVPKPEPVPISPLVSTKPKKPGKQKAVKVKAKRVCHVCFRAFTNNILLGRKRLECSECGVLVHPMCYGHHKEKVKTPWRCDKCVAGVTNLPACAICSLTDFAAYKRTEDGRWAHLACAMWVPMTDVRNQTKMEPITGIQQIVPDRKILVCCYCKKRGNCIQCWSGRCTTAFHVLCVLKHDPRLLVCVTLFEKRVYAFCDTHHPSYLPGHAPVQATKETKLDDLEEELSDDGGESDESSVESESAPDLRCKKCGKSFKWEGTYQRHMRFCRATQRNRAYLDQVWTVLSVPSAPEAQPTPLRVCPHCPMRKVPGVPELCFAQHLHTHHRGFLSKDTVLVNKLLQRNLSIQTILEHVEEEADS